MISTGVHPWAWVLFAAVVVAALAVDLGFFHRSARVVSMKEAAVWTGIWTLLSLLFCGFIRHRFGTDRALEFMQAWLLEQALSVDNVFVFLVIFSYFHVKPAYQHRVLFWGILGAVVTRGLFILAGALVINRFHWVMYLLGLFLLVTAVKMLRSGDDQLDPSRQPLLRLFRRLIPSTADYEEAKFLVRREGRWLATPLLAVLVVVEATDVVFAVDSIPAVFGVTRHVFVVYTSNIFAILGLRSLFFLIAGLMERLVYLKIGVAVILAFIGAKILIEPLFKIPTAWSLGILAAVLAISAGVSLLFAPRGDSS